MLSAVTEAAPSGKDEVGVAPGEGFPLPKARTRALHGGWVRSSMLLPAATGSRSLRPNVGSEHHRHPQEELRILGQS